MAKKSSKKYLKEANAQIILFVLVMIIMRMVVLNFMSEISGIEFEELSKARIYNGDITATLFLERLVNFFGNFILETYKGITLLAIINVFVASYILTKKDFTGNFYFNLIIAYLFSTIITVFLLLAGIILFFLYNAMYGSYKFIKGRCVFRNFVVSYIFISRNSFYKVF